MDKYPETYEDYQAMNPKNSVSELEFYKHGYSLLFQSLETKIQEAHGLKIKNEILHSDLMEVTELSEKLKEEIGDSVLKLDDVKRKHMALVHKYDAMHMENEHLKQKVVKLKKDIEKMVTLNDIEKLLDIKLARLENNIIGQLPSRLPPNSIPKVIPEVKNSNINNTTPGTPSQQPATCSVLLSNEKTFNVECIELAKQCSEWWCPMHSDFKKLIKLVKPSNQDDELIIKRAKSRYAYWCKGDMVRCCTTDRKRSVAIKKYDMPSCWPTSMPVDIDKLTENFAKL